MSSNYSDPRAFNAAFPGPEQKPRGWWSRNWKWFVPTIMLCMLLLCGGCLSGIFFFYSFGLRHLEPYMVAMEKIQDDKQIQESLGQPIRDNSWFPVLSPNGDNLDIRWDLAGPKGVGKAYVKSRVFGNKMEISLIEVTLPGGKKVMLQEEGGQNAAPAFELPGEAPTEKKAAEGEKKMGVAPAPDLNLDIPAPDEEETKK
jgi:hypothetical protein